MHIRQDGFASDRRNKEAPLSRSIDLWAVAGQRRNEDRQCASIESRYERTALDRFGKARGQNSRRFLICVTKTQALVLTPECRSSTMRIEIEPD